MNVDGIARRHALAGALLATPLFTRAQQPGRVYRIAYVSVGRPGPQPPAFMQGLRDLGYVEGQNVVIERRYAEGQEERLPALVAEVMRSNPELLVAASTTVTRAMMQATTTIPIVFGASADPVRYGLVPNLARPGGNVTGFSLAEGTSGFAAKLLQLLKQAVPKLAQMAVLYTDLREHDAHKVQELQAAAELLKVKVDAYNTERDAAFDEALAAIGASAGRGPARGLVVTGSPLFDLRRAQLIAFAADKRLPAIYYRATWADAGGLMSYGPNTSDVGRQAAAYIDRILKGAKAGELPVMQPTQFDLVINLKTARTLGLEIPRALLLSAARVIE